MRKCIISLIILFFSMGVMAQSDNISGKEHARGGNQQMYALGDVNGDGNVSVADVMTLVDYLLGIPNDDFLIEYADTNRDGTISVADVMRLVDMILGIYEDKTIINVIVNTGDDSITYGGGGSTPAHAGQNNIWEK